jgi:hypothetical protein
MQNSVRSMLVLALVLPGCGGGDTATITVTTTPSPSAVKRERQVLSARFKAPGGDRADSDGADPSSPRQRAATPLVTRSSTTLLGENRSVVRSVLGPPSRGGRGSWTYVVARHRPSDGLGGWCTRQLVVEFDGSDKVSQIGIGAYRCPRDLNE